MCHREELSHASARSTSHRQEELYGGASNLQEQHSKAEAVCLAAQQSALESCRRPSGPPALPAPGLQWRMPSAAKRPRRASAPVPAQGSWLRPHRRHHPPRRSDSFVLFALAQKVPQKVLFDFAWQGAGSMAGWRLATGEQAGPLNAPQRYLRDYVPRALNTGGTKPLGLLRLRKSPAGLIRSSRRPGTRRSLSRPSAARRRRRCRSGARRSRAGDGPRARAAADRLPAPRARTRSRSRQSA